MNTENARSGVFPESGSRIAGDREDRLENALRLISEQRDEARGIAEKLAAALRDFIVYCEHHFSHADSRAPWPTVGKAAAALAEFEKLRASAPVENRGTE